MKVIFACLVLAIGLNGCGQLISPSESGEIPSQQATQEQDAPYPSIIPTPIASEGTVIGTLVSTTTGGSFAGLGLYFGTLLPLTPGPDHLVNLDLTNSPKTVIRSDGRFIAENIAPGKYVLVIWTPHESRYVPDPNNSERDLIVEVIGGQIVNLGTLQVSPPQ